MNRFSHVDLAAPPCPPACGGGQGGRLHRACVNDHRARRRRVPPPFPPAGGQGGAQRVVALRGVFGHEGQGGSAAPEPVEATKARSSSLTSLG